MPALRIARNAASGSANYCAVAGASQERAAGEVMGDIADMILDGTLCEGCGAFLNDDAPGYPCRCGSCASELKAEKKTANIAAHQAHIASQRKCKCPTCGRKVKEVGLKDHMRDAHGAA
jgi:hypothetical protein